MKNVDKAIFLFSKDEFDESEVRSFSHRDCETMAGSYDYMEDDSIVKIDGSIYGSVGNAIVGEGFDQSEYYVKAFGF